MKAAYKRNRDGSQQFLFGKVILKEQPNRKRDPRFQWKFSLEIMRLREIELIIRHRHERGIPDPEGTDDTENCMAYIQAVASTPRSQSVVDWCKTWAPWISNDALLGLVWTHRRRKYMLGAESTAKLLHVTMKERDALGLKTIGACDVSEEERKAISKKLKQERDRIRQQENRQAKGTVPRGSYEAASAESLKPWEAAGVSRRTWYRKRGTGPSRVDIYRNGDTPVPTSQTPLSKEKKPALADIPTDMHQARAAGLMVGLGDHPPAGLQGAAPHGNGDTGTHERAA
jgi:hypothetical protein